LNRAKLTVNTKISFQPVNLFKKTRDSVH